MKFVRGVAPPEEVVYLGNKGEFDLPTDMNPTIRYEFDGSTSFKLTIVDEYDGGFWFAKEDIEALIEFLEYAKTQLKKD